MLDQTIIDVNFSEMYMADFFFSYFNNVRSEIVEIEYSNKNEMRR